MLYQALEARYGFAIPTTYRQLEQRGCFAAQKFDRERPISSIYLWLHDTEWWSIEEMLSYQPPEYYKPGFAPFAGTGTGDFWCWWPERASETGIPITLCPHDLNQAHIDAPNFAGWVYRRVLDYAHGDIKPASEVEARAWLRRWLDELTPLLPPNWTQTLAALVVAPLKQWTVNGYSQSGFITTDEYEAIVRRDLACPGLDEPFKWMLDLR